MLPIRKTVLIAVAASCLAVSGCTSNQDLLLAESGLKTNDPKFYPSDDHVRAGKAHFRNGDYGLASERYRKAVEIAPRDADAWVGLAASYDRERQFKLADQAYSRAIRLVGVNTVILNNQGYSYMLRGDLRKARGKFLAAFEREPDNPYIKNNLELLNESEKSIKRVRS
jgi:Flp pilus assembly protein TadD